MAISPSAFGPLSAGTKHAAGLLSGGTSGSAGGGFGLRRLSGRPSFGEPQETPAVESPVGLATGAQAPIEEQQPLLPEGEATGERGDITQLPGFQAAASEGGLAELPSTDELTGADQRQASEFRNQLQRLMDEGGPDSSVLDATKAIKGTSSALKLNSSLQRLAKDFGLLGSSTLSLAPSTVAGLGPGAAATGFAPLTAKGLGEATAGGAAGAGAGLGTATAGAGAISALLGLLAATTGNKELGQAAQGAGIGTGLLGLANTGTSLASLAPLLGTTTAAVPTGAAAGLGAGGATGLAAGGAAGIGTAAGAAFAPIAALLLVDAAMGLAGSKDAPNLIGSAMGHRSIVGDYPGFVPELMQNAGQQGTAFGALSQALPYAQSKEELGRLVNTYKNYIQTTTGIGLDDAQDNPYALDAIPGVGAVTHGQPTPPVDWGPQQRQLQGLVDLLAEGLPGTRITGGYGDPAGGGLSGPDDTMRLWTQFLDRERNAPLYSRGVPEAFVNTGASEYVKPGFYGTRQTPDDLAYGQEGYDYAGSGFPSPGQFVGQPSALWQQLTGGGGSTAPAAAPAGDSGMPTDLIGLQRLMAAAQPKAGALAPNVPSEFSEAARNPEALQALLANPGLLARLFSGGGAA